MTDQNQLLREAAQKMIDAINKADHWEDLGDAKSGLLTALAQPAEAPTAFVHTPLSGPPRLVWYSNKALESAIRKASEGPQPDVLLYTTPPASQEPFGYFKAEPFGWTDCDETDEGAIALYEHQPAVVPEDVRKAVLAEREACANLMEEMRAKSRHHLFRSALTCAAGEIRARTAAQAQEGGK